jgi:hypothetical protein
MVTDRLAGVRSAGDAAGGAALATGRGSAEENARIPEVQAGGRGGARSGRGTPSFIFCNAAMTEIVPHDMLLSGFSNPLTQVAFEVASRGSEACRLEMMIVDLPDREDASVEQSAMAPVPAVATVPETPARPG